MKKTTLHKASLLGLILGLGIGCITPYEPEGMEQSSNLLVVEGSVIAPYGTQIKLSRTVPLTQSDHSSSDNLDKGISEKATITVITDDGQTVASAEPVIGANLYEVKDSIAFLPGKKYAIHIRLDNKEYQSAFVEPQITPEIDEMSYQYKELQQVDIRISTHDDRPNSSKYFRWKYEEDWEIRSQHFGNVHWEDDVLTNIRLDSPQNRYYCWKKDKSINFLLGQSTQAQNNQIKDHNLITIPRYDSRLSYLYSVLVRQYALDKDAFEYFQNLQKNIDETGSLFAPQPIEMKGNITCLTHPEETVIGYINASTETTYRYYIEAYKMPGMEDDYNCREKELFFEDQLRIAYSKGLAIKNRIYTEGGGILYECLNKRCIDCTTRGGTKNKPDFWPNDHQ